MWHYSSDTPILADTHLLWICIALAGPWDTHRYARAHEGTRRHKNKYDSDDCDIQSEKRLDGTNICGFRLADRTDAHDEVTR